MTTKRAATGKTIAANMGMTVIMITAVPMKWKDKFMRVRIVPGNVWSQELTSLENLLIILPIGVVSKKDMGLLITLSNI